MAQPPSKRLVTEATLATVQADQDAALPGKVATALDGTSAKAKVKAQALDALTTPEARATILERVAAAPNTAGPLAAWEAALATGSATVVWLGSSTTFGSNATNPANRYHEIVTRAIQAAYPSGVPGWEYPTQNAGAGYPTVPTRPGVQSYVSAAGGANSETYVTSVARPFILWHKPALIVHMIGSNDSTDTEPYAVPVNEYEANVAAEVDAFAAGINRPVSQVLVHAFRRFGVTEAKWATYLQALRNIAKTRPNVLVLDLSQEYERLQHIDPDPFGLLDTDITHQTDAGHRLMADLLVKGLRVPPAAGPDPRDALVDTFTRPNGPGGVPEYPAGRTYERQGAAVEAIQGNRLVLTTPGTVLLEAGLADLEVDALVTLPTQAETGLPGLVFRGTDDSNRMGLFFNAPAALSVLYKTQGGTTAVLASAATPWGAGDYLIKVRAKGDRIWGYVNGVKRIDYTMTAAEVTALAGRTKIGVRNNAAAPGVFWHFLRARRV